MQLLPGKLKLTKIDNSQCLFQLKAHWWQLCPIPMLRAPTAGRRMAAKKCCHDLNQLQSIRELFEAQLEAKGSREWHGMAISGLFFASVYTSISMKQHETTWNNMKQHETTCFTTFFTTWNNYNCNYCIFFCKDPQRSFMDLWKHDGKKVPSPGGGWLWAGASSASDCGLLRCETFGVWKFPDCRGFCIAHISKWWFLTNYLQSYNILFHTISSI